MPAQSTKTLNGFGSKYIMKMNIYQNIQMKIYNKYIYIIFILYIFHYI